MFCRSITLAIFLPCLLCEPGHAKGESRFFEPTPGFLRAKDLPPGFRGKVNAIAFNIKDAFEGAVTHSEAEEAVYEVGNKLHIETRPSTVRRRLLFREGDMVTSDLLQETEKQLRSEEFLADAIIEVNPRPDSTLDVKVTTYDQWTTVPGVSLNRKYGEWVWWLGPVESNLLGTGQRLAFFVGHDLERDSRWLDYNYNAFTPYKLRLASQYAWLSDGYSYAFSLGRPLLSRSEKWSFNLSATGVESGENLYLSANDLEQIESAGRLAPNARKLLGGTNVLAYWTKIGTHKTYAGITRSFGYSLKSSITPYYERKDRYNAGTFGIPDSAALAIWDSLGYPRTSPELNTRHDELFGLSLSLYQYAYKTVSNFRNLKWSESIETGWRLTASLAQNQEWLGAKNPDLFLSYTGVYNNAWWNALFLNTNASLKYFLSPKGEYDDGITSGYFETQWKPTLFTATVMTAQYDHLFASAESRRLFLGEESGLIGFPNFYYGGKARTLFAAEQRLFPPFEAGTLVPAFAIFMNAGNTYSSYETVDLTDLHYAIGIGLRLGATRSVQKVVNHLNFVWPIGEKNLDTWTWGIRASKSL